MPIITGNAVELDNAGGWAAGNGGLKIVGDAYAVANSAHDCFFGAQGNTNVPTNSGVGLQMAVGYLTLHVVSVQPRPYIRESGWHLGRLSRVIQTGGYWTSKVMMLDRYISAAGLQTSTVREMPSCKPTEFIRPAALSRLLTHK